MDSIAGITWERLEARVVGHLSVRQGRRPGRSRRVHRQLPDANRPGEVRARRSDFRGRAAGRRLPDGADHGPAAGALAHGIDDAARVEPGLHRAGTGGVGASARSRSAGVAPGGTLTIESRRGSISLYARADDGMPRGAVFVPFCFYEAAANMLTNPVLDPFGKIPEFKVLCDQSDCRRRGSRAFEFRRGQILEGAVSGALGRAEPPLARLSALGFRAQAHRARAQSPEP